MDEEKVNLRSGPDSATRDSVAPGKDKEFEKEEQGELPWYKQRKLSSAKNDPFGDEEDADVKYKSMEWWQAAMIMIAETVSLGILSLPSVLETIGMAPGVILIAGLGILATYTGYVFWQFKMAYPHVHNMADAGEVLCGRIGREIGGAAQTIFLIFSMASHILTFTIAFNAMTGHATCTIVWGVIGVIVFFLLTLPRTLKKVSYLSIVSFMSITGSILITMIGVGVSKPNPHPVAVNHVSFAKAFLAVTNIIFAYAGHVAFFSFISELKDPRDFPKGLFLLQITDTLLYIIVAVVVYRYAGPSVKSPAIGSASPIVMKVAYGIALPTILIAGVIYAHVAAKYVYVRLFRGTKHMQKKTFLAVGSWVAITLTFWIIAFVIAESIPDFNDLLALISSVFASWFTYGLGGVFWLYMNKGMYGKKWYLTLLNVGLVIMGAAIMGLGLYASGTAIKEGGGASWSCKDNSVGTG
ncbi:hypothetical protein BT63DRAFT_379199 [Microthyrium microscopicum]|uniref:Amino acid transporter transmembrane domain-containing protein n=1 Tax=Microthyrium microscopicum TaxID=703497 RepID=A0A6A6TXF1_9PEZI|nr:hypothetical protein BT63DRAFT_379199 [Microthyrium microscopicum]